MRGFKTRHSGSAGVGRSSEPVTTGSSRAADDFVGYRLSTKRDGKGGENYSQYSNDPNQPPLSAFVNRVNHFH